VSRGRLEGDFSPLISLSPFPPPLLACTHTNKAKPSAAIIAPSEPTPGCLALEPFEANSPGPGLVTYRRAVQISWIEVAEHSTTTSH